MKCIRTLSNRHTNYGRGPVCCARDLSRCACVLVECTFFFACNIHSYARIILVYWLFLLIFMQEFLSFLKLTESRRRAQQQKQKRNRFSKSAGSRTIIFRLWYLNLTAFWCRSVRLCACVVVWYVWGMLLRSTYVSGWQSWISLFFISFFFFLFLSFLRISIIDVCARVRWHYVQGPFNNRPSQPINSNSLDSVFLSQRLYRIEEQQQQQQYTHWNLHFLASSLTWTRECYKQTDDRMTKRFVEHPAPLIQIENSKILIQRSLLRRKYNNDRPAFIRRCDNEANSKNIFDDRPKHHEMKRMHQQFRSETEEKKQHKIIKRGCVCTCNKCKVKQRIHAVHECTHAMQSQITKCIKSTVCCYCCC